MVSIVTSLGKSGLSDWLLQRITAVVLGGYPIDLTVVCFSHNVDFTLWSQFFASTFNKNFTLFTLVALLVHAWIGLWTVTTDYVKPLFLRLCLQIFVNTSLLAFLLFGINILWR